MIEFLTETGNIPFSVALALMIGITVLEGVALLIGFALFSTIGPLLPGVNVDVKTSSFSSRTLGWLRIGQVPLLMLLVVFLTAFGLIGLTLQSFAQSMTGSLLPAALISIPALLLSLPIVRVLGGALHKMIPRDETDAVTEESLVGRIATITLGTAFVDKPAEAKVRDLHGTTHYVMVEPDAKGKLFTSSHSILLVRKEGAIFKAIENTNPALIDHDIA
ncbi:MAG: YqiJ family protein [Gammaproteobacteria bacterium]|nr:YqiJ family protein [Gammaproteobacteria bacterium]MCF6229198.1 YqiJ family protein [Gammaproteobacteria bacterium]